MENIKVGDKILFGRTHGEKTLGTVMKVNRKTVAVRQDESRGTMRDYKVGTKWKVPFTLCYPANGHTAAVAAPVAPKRDEANVLRDIVDAYCALSPENLSCDGELPMAQVRKRSSELHRTLHRLFMELGRHVDEEEAYRLDEAHRFPHRHAFGVAR
jgi:hypothetical protein